MNGTFDYISNELAEHITVLMAEKERVLVAMDGRSASGKTTLAKTVAEKLRESMTCEVIHMDDFFLRPEQRTAERLGQPGGNVDAERFMEEVLKPLSEGNAFSYRPYDCRTQSLKTPVSVPECKAVLVEGAYSCRPDLWEYYDIHIFLDIDSETQLERITMRNGKEGAEQFKKRWIPLEEAYFKAYQVREKSELCYRMGE